MKRADSWPAGLALVAFGLLGLGFHVEYAGWVLALGMALLVFTD